MSTYSETLAGARGRAPSVAGSATTVGQDIEDNQVYSTNHPVYEAYTAMLTQKMREIHNRETVRQSASALAVCTAAVSTDVQADLERTYPEFRIKWLPMNTPAHAAWVAHRSLGNQWMASRVSRYAESTIHYGGSALPYMVNGNRSVHLEINVASPQMVHDAYADSIDVLRFGKTPLTAQREVGVSVAPADYQAYTKQSVWRKCSSGTKCRHQAGGLLVDMTTADLSPMQFMAAMEQCGAEVGYVMLPYHPSMAVHTTGELVGTGVQYRVDKDRVHFMYPEGVAGITSMSAVNWHQWQAAMVRTLNTKRSSVYQFELVKNRGPFLFVHVVKLPTGAAMPTKVIHALEMPDSQDMTLVKTWRLRDLLVDTSLPSSWSEVWLTVPSRVVEKTYEYAMGLPAKSFTSYAIRKRLSVVNDRVIIQGTNVEVHEPMTAQQLNDLEQAIFTRAFVDRYEMGMLQKNLMQNLSAVMGFSSVSYAHRLLAVFMATASTVWDWTVGLLGSAIDSVCRSITRILRYWSGQTKVSRLPQFMAAPAFIKYEYLIAGWKDKVLGKLSPVLSTFPGGGDIALAVRGAYYMSALHSSVPTARASDSPVLASFSVPVDGTVTSQAGFIFDDYLDTREPGPDNATSDVAAVYDGMRERNDFQEASHTRHLMRSVYAVPNETAELPVVDFSVDPGYVTTITEMHEAAFPGMAKPDFHYDTSSLMTDDQHRALQADSMHLPYYFGELPAPKFVYKSNIRAFGVTKRPQVAQETLSAVAARNTSAPVLTRPQDNPLLVREVWDVFLEEACLPNARAMLAQYQLEPIALEEGAFQDWMKKAKPDAIKTLAKEIKDSMRALEDMSVNQYLMMLKSDAKPPLSDKPLYTRVEPQVIVYHEKPLSALYSSIFRVLVRRFLSILKPKYLLNLLKDSSKVRDHIQAQHPWHLSEDVLKYLENDFSKYDKSQGEFVFMLEAFVFEQLGMDKDLLKRWGVGHEECTLICMSLGISLHVRYQRKSGDATTAFGNGLTNIICVTYAYRGTDVAWGVFMGDDSLICARRVMHTEDAIQTMAEKFNLMAKFFITKSPYMTSAFVRIIRGIDMVILIPDPFKRAQRWSMAISADEPMWDERYRSAVDSLAVYRTRAFMSGLGDALHERYTIQPGFDTQAFADAIATALETPEKFRAMWETARTRIDY